MVEAPNKFYIKGHVPSSKNGKRCICNRRAKSKTGTTNEAGVLLSSEATEKYLNSTKMAWFDQASRFRRFVAENKLQYPLTIRFTFIRATNQDFDWVGPLETVQDCMTGKKFEASLKGLKVKNNLFAWLPDDSMRYITPIINPAHLVDREGAGVIIEVILP